MARGYHGGYSYPRSIETTPSRRGGGLILLGGAATIAGVGHLMLGDSKLDLLGDRGSDEAPLSVQQDFAAEIDPMYQQADAAAQFVLSYLDAPERDIKTGTGVLGSLDAEHATYTPYGTGSHCLGSEYDPYQSAQVIGTDEGITVVPGDIPEYAYPEEFPTLHFTLGNGTYGAMAPLDEATENIIADGCEIERHGIFQADF